MFSFTNPIGACETCRGFGRTIEIDMNLVIPDRKKSIDEGAVKPWTTAIAGELFRDLKKFCRSTGIRTDIPFEEIPREDQDAIINGTPDFYGIRGFFDWLDRKTYKMHVRVYLSRYRGYRPCERCGGTRLKTESLAYRIEGRHIGEVFSMPVRDAHDFLRGLSLTKRGKAVDLLLKELLQRLSYLNDVGLSYLTLDRQSRSLSGGEVERVNLTRALGSSLVNTLYVLDEPSIGLHPRDNERLIGILSRLKKNGNTVLVVEHEPEVMKRSDLILELGPGRGETGGELVFSRTYNEILKSDNSLTGLYLSGRKTIPTPAERRKPREGHALRIEGARANNLKKISLEIPLGLLVALTGVSGSGKSTLVENVILPGYKRHRREPVPEEPAFDAISGFEKITDLVLVDQSPAGRTPRANAATYTKAFDGIRRIFASTPMAGDRGYTPGTFSFNAEGGRCETCRGEGFEKVEMQFLSDVFITCPDCEGKRYKEEILEIEWNGKNIDDVLGMTVDEAMEFFRDHRDIREKLVALVAVGLGYLRLKQGANTLSGGEAQRLKLAKAVSQPRGKGGRLYIFDEPTTGLHFDDVRNLIETLQGIISEGNSVLVIEHNLDVIRSADWVIDLGPEGGDEGGEMVAAGTPEEISQVPASHTGAFLRKIFDEEAKRGERAAERPAAYKKTEAAKRDESIRVEGAREHNLKNLSLSIPRQNLVVITGLSGSGKSTLAFDILFAEGQRRYLESLPAYAKQFIDTLERPEIDRISGLPPTIAVEQKLSSGGARSTVSTITEIYHYLRLLYAKTGTPHCPECGLAIAASTEAEILRFILKQFNGKTVSLLAPLIVDRKGHYKELLGKLEKRGVEHVRIDGRYGAPADFGPLARYAEHDIDMEVFRGEVSANERAGVAKALHRCFIEGKGLARVRAGKMERLFNLRSSCPRCGLSYALDDPKLFSFNSRKGWCPACEGLGFKELFSPDSVVPDPSKSIEGEAIEILSGPLAGRTRQKVLAELSDLLGTEVRRPFSRLSKKVQREILFGNGRFDGLIPRLERLFEQTGREAVRSHLATYRAEVPCPDCAGGRLKRESLSVRFRGKTIAELASLPVAHALAFFSAVKLSGREESIAKEIVAEIRNRLLALRALGLDYLALDRRADTLSGGEAQRIRIAAQLGSNLRGILYILDEPTIGLHPSDGKRLIGTLRTLRDRGASVIVVEHDEAMIRSADHIIDLGPGAGPAGGRLVASGTVAEIQRTRDSITGECLRNPPSMKRARRPVPAWNGRIKIKGACEFNLKAIDVEIPLGALTCVTGVSGAGKSTLVKEILYKGLKRKLGQNAGRPGKHKDITGWEKIGRIAEVDQSPIGRTPRSVPASYVGFLDDIRRIFSMLPESRVRGWAPGRFSFNVRGGRCERCAGQGRIKVEMSFLPDVYVECEECGGSRFNQETLAVRFKGKSIADILSMTASEALPCFEGFSQISRFLEIMIESGLGYLALGQASHTLSGGEAQRVKLATELGRAGRGHTLYVLDEPTTGLHMADIANLMRVFDSLVANGHTLVVIEHNLEVISQADHIIDLGPGGGDEGGRITASGPPEALAGKPGKSLTARYVKKYFRSSTKNS
jgi:excinuclease ABC subunit A